MKFRLRLLVILTTLVLSPRLSAQTLEKTVTTEHGVTFHLPADWEAVPKAVLEKAIEDVGNLSQTGMRPEYGLAFQRRHEGEGMAQPYIAVQIRRGGRVRESEMRKHHQIKKSIDKGVELITEHAGSLMSDLKVGEPSYEEESHTLWMSMESTVEGVGTVCAISALRLTEFGGVQLSGYYPKADADKDLPVIEAIMRGVEMDESIRYKPRASDAHSALTLFDRLQIPLLIGAIFVIGSAISAASKRARKRKN